MKVRIINITKPAWYEDCLDYIFIVKEKPLDYANGLGYQLIKSNKGILLKDCVIIPSQKEYPTLTKRDYK